MSMYPQLVICYTEDCNPGRHGIWKSFSMVACLGGLSNEEASLKFLENLRKKKKHNGVSTTPIFTSSYSATLSVLQRIGTMLCPTPPQQQQPQSLQALSRSQSLRLQQSRSLRTSQRCRSLNYNSGLNSLNIKKSLSRLPLLNKSSHDDNSNHHKQQYQTTGSDDSNPTESLLLSVSPHADTDQDELGNVTRIVFQGSVDSYPSVSPLPCSSTQADTDYDGLDSAGSDDSNLSDSLLASSSPRISTNYEEPGNLASEVGPSGSNPSESLAINISLQDERNDFGQSHHRTRVMLKTYTHIKL
ncbi:uncharacterized protein Pyn_25547 [Prunus yedoensis var. nudiflora]|uniref:Uncharacterized protein n=1 Tax=Prunus yedoensis var. nudiflora TaxID=2094558 RepID=A0A314Z1L8_PRUYE|nr:uncharacterized protein Pyn_25547 [Prunus yedoensis var. nudiflora]